MLYRQCNNILATLKALLFHYENKMLKIIQSQNMTTHFKKLQM